MGSSMSPIIISWYGGSMTIKTGTSFSNFEVTNSGCSILYTLIIGNAIENCYLEIESCSFVSIAVGSSIG
jgi:hypothetical protein